MNTALKSDKLKKIARAAKPWAFLVGAFLVLKVTGAGSAISDLTRAAAMKTGAMDIEPEATVTGGQAFDYDFTIRDLQGNKLPMSELKGKVIFLNLWATWCGPCRVEMPSIQKLYNSVDKDKIAFVMLSLDQDNQSDKIRQFVSGKEFSFPVYQPASPLPKMLRVNMIPTTFIIGADGKVRTKKTGMANYDTEEMREFLAKLVAE